MRDKPFSNKYVVDYSDVDIKRTLCPAHLVDFLQSISVKHSDAVGYDLDFFERESIGWVLLYWHIEISRWPAEGEELLISTWSDEYRRIQANRNFNVIDQNDQEICYGASRWVLVDTARRRPTKPEKNFLDAYKFRESPGFKDEDFSMPDPPDRAPDITEYTVVTRRDMDTNGHTNNAVYVAWAMDSVPDEIYDNREAYDIRVSYKKECFRGTRVKISTWHDDSMTISVFCDAEKPSSVFGQVVTLWK